MLRLKTKTEFTVPTDRGARQAIVRIIVDGIFMDKNNASPQGYYYYIDDNNQPIVLSKIRNAVQLWENVALAENQLPLLQSSLNLYSNLIQRIKEFTLLQLKMEAISEPGVNFGTTDTDYEIDND